MGQKVCGRCVHNGGTKRESVGGVLDPIMYHEMHFNRLVYPVSDDSHIEHAFESVQSIGNEFAVVTFSYNIIDPRLPTAPGNGPSNFLDTSCGHDSYNTAGGSFSTLACAFASNSVTSSSLASMSSGGRTDGFQGAGIGAPYV